MHCNMHRSGCRMTQKSRKLRDFSQKTSEKTTLFDSFMGFGGMLIINPCITVGSLNEISIFIKGPFYFPFLSFIMHCGSVRKVEKCTVAVFWQDPSKKNMRRTATTKWVNMAMLLMDIVVVDDLAKKKQEGSSIATQMKTV